MQKALAAGRRIAFAAVIVLSVGRGAEAAQPVFGPYALFEGTVNPETTLDDLPQVAGDATGTWVAVWPSIDPVGPLGFDFDIFVSRSTDGAVTWSSPVILNPNAATDSAHDLPQSVVTDGAGTWIVLWMSGTFHGAPGNDVDLWITRSTNGGATWSAPTPLNPDAATDSKDDSDAQLVTDGAGVWVATWSAGGEVVSVRSTDTGASWTAPVTMSIDSHYEGWPTIATDRAGTWLALWLTDDVDVPGQGTYDLLKMSRSTDGGATWSVAVQPPGLFAGGVPRLATDRAGNWIAVWQSSFNAFFDDIVAARSTDAGASWTVTKLTPIDDFGILDDHPQVATDGPGSWVAVWSSFRSFVGVPRGQDRDVLIVRSTDGGATWTPPSALNANASTGDGGDDFPFVATDGAGTWVALWAGTDATKFLFISADREPRCATLPRNDCRLAATPQGARLTIKDRTPDAGDLLRWKWRGEETLLQHFGDPGASTAYTLCVYDRMGGTPRVVAGIPAPVGETCIATPCWRATGAGFAYRNWLTVQRGRAVDGLTTVLLTPGADKKARILVQAQRENLDVPSLPLTLPVTVQLDASNGECWQATYGTARKNVTTLFEATSD